MTRTVFLWYIVVLIISGLQQVHPDGDHGDLPAIAGRSLLVPCISVTGGPVYPLENTPKNAVQTNEGFIIKNVPESLNGGLLRCGNDPTSDEFFECWHLKVSDYLPLETPNIVQGAVSQAVQGNEMHLECQLTVREGERFNLRWIVPNSVPNHRWSYHTDLMVVTDGSSPRTIRTMKLTVKDVEKTDAGNYVCAADDYDEKTQSSVRIEIRDPEPLEEPVITHEGIPRDVARIIQGNNLMLVCLITVPVGDKFSLFWKVPDSAQTRINYNRDPIFVGADGSRIKWKSRLTITDVEFSDRGNYTCVAEGITSEASSFIEILVWEPGHITGGEVVRVNLNQPASLSCVVEGYPLSNFIWDKIDDSKNSIDSVKGSSTLDENESRVVMSLGFASVTRDDNGTYECSATNYNDTITSRTSLIVTEVPEIKISSTLSNGTDSVYLNWTMYDGNDPVTLYSVQQKKEGTDQWVNCSGEMGKGNSEFVARGLEKGTLYQFRITAANSVGVSQPAYSKLAETLRTDPEFVTEVLVTRTSNTSIQASWTPPEGEGRGHFHYYKLLAKYGNDVRKAVRLPLNVTDYVFPNLISGADYEVEISACNEYTLKCVRSSEGPGFAPIILINGTTRDSATIGWSAPPEELRHRVSRYKVMAIIQDRIIGPVYLSNTSNSYVFENLKADASPYTLRVAACSGVETRCGRWSVEVKAVVVDDGALTSETNEKECRKCLCL